MGEEFGDSTFNMSLQTLKRIDNLLVNYHNYKMMGFYKGNPLYKTFITILDSCYDEVRPNLTDAEKKIGDAYVQIFFGTNMFEGKQITLLNEKGDSTKVSGAFVPIMRDWVHFIYDMLWSHKMLMQRGDDLSDVIE